VASTRPPQVRKRHPLSGELPVQQSRRGKCPGSGEANKPPSAKFSPPVRSAPLASMKTTTGCASLIIADRSLPRVGNHWRDGRSAGYFRNGYRVTKQALADNVHLDGVRIAARKELSVVYHWNAGTTERRTRPIRSWRHDPGGHVPRRSEATRRGPETDGVAGKTSELIRRRRSFYHQV